MARIQHLIIILLLSIPAFLPNTVLADYPSIAVYRTTSSPVFEDSTAHGSLDKFVAHFSTCSGSTGNRVSGVIEKLATTYRVNWVTCFNGSQYGTQYIDTNKMDKCGDVYETYNGVCVGSPPPPTCTPPLVLDQVTNTCKDVCLPLKDKETQYFTQGQSWPLACNTGCQTEGISGDCGYNSAGLQGCFYYGKYNGKSCDGSEAGTGTAPPASGQSPEYDCIKNGKSYGNINGIVVCYPVGSPGSSPVTSYTPKTSSSGTTSTTANGTTTTTTTSETGSKVVSFNSNGTVTTTSTGTGTNADGSTTATSGSKTESFADFCKNNPNFAQCKAANESTFKGDCVDGVSTVSCDGDSIQCAIAKAQADNRCADTKQDNLNRLGDRLITGTTTVEDLGGTDKFGAPINVPIGSLDTSSFLPKGCLPDMSFNIGSHAIVLPLSRLCDGLQTAGNIVLAFAYMLAARIIFM